MFDQIDINKDGLISFEEFSNMIKGIIAAWISIK
jgi:Ca2+-binding EF-hand superfamily protein